MRFASFLLAALLVSTSAAAQTGWILVWSDEFSGAAQSPPAASKWSYDLGAGGWGNAELETYTNAIDNVRLDGRGNLAIRALASSGQYTSGRIKTQGIFDVTYGRIEARIKLPYGVGVWPAFWMLGANISSVGWPTCGEIDIMENIGSEPSSVHGSMHGPGYSGGNPITAVYTLPGGIRYSDDFHVFSIDWSPDAVEFFVDSTSYQKVTRSSIPAGKTWVFDKPFFLLLNIAIGGTFPGKPDASTTFPQEMLVDYVRVYQTTGPPTVSAIGLLNAASFTSALAPGSIATVFGTGLADVNTDLFDASAGAFVLSAGTTTISVNGLFSPLLYASPTQINFQVPWESPLGTPLQVQVTRNGMTSNASSITISATAPAAFSDKGVAVLTCIGGRVMAGAACTLWGNGFGVKDPQQQDGVPSSFGRLALTVSACKLTVAGIDASVTYCGAAPGLIIDQLNFIYPLGVPQTGLASATLTVGDASIDLVMPQQQ